MNDTLQEFFNDVYEITRQIPRGKVLTYGKIAVLAGRPQHARWVGRAMAQAPADDTPLDIAALVCFYDGLHLTPAQIRGTVEGRLSWDNQMKQVLTELFEA